MSANAIISAVNHRRIRRARAWLESRPAAEEVLIEEREIAVELIGREDNESILFWEAAEGGIGVWERLIAEPREFRTLAARALELLHFDPSSGQALPHWEERCTVACYDCLLSYSNQPDHRHLDRHKVRDFLFSLSRSDVAPVTNGPTYEEQYRRLLGLVDPASKLRASAAPSRSCAAYARSRHPRSTRLLLRARWHSRDLHFHRRSQHHDPHQAERDRAVREALKDQGFRVVAIKSGQTIADQISENIDIFRRH